MRHLIITAVVAASSCAFSGELSDIYFQKVRTNFNEWTKARIQPQKTAFYIPTNGAITEVGIERTVCYGTCPAYTFIVKRDGSFRYKGEKFAQPQGEFTGTIMAGEFARLAQFIKDAGFMQLSDTYERGITDHSSVFTMVVMNGERKVISDYAEAGPSKLWAIERLIDDLLTEAHLNDPPRAEGAKK